MSTVTAYAATSATEPLARTTINRRDVGPHDVLIDIEFAGICHSDIHTARDEWGRTSYPLVPGHEIAGIVAEVGSEVTKFARSATASASAAWSTPAASARTAGPARSSTAPRASSGPTTPSAGTASRPTAATATHIVVDEDYVLRIPDGHGARRRRAAAVRWHHRCTPRCGTGTPARASGLRSSASAASATWASRSPPRWARRSRCCRQSLKKQEDGLRLGADHYYATSDPATFEQLRRPAST